MISEQHRQFEERRLEVMRKYTANSPELRKLRRRRYRMMFTSFLGSVVVTMVVLALLKSFLMAYEGQAGYARLITPFVEAHDADSIVGMALLPDPVTTAVSAAIAPILPRKSAFDAPARPIISEQLFTQPAGIENESATMAEPDSSPRPEPDRLFPSPSAD